MITTAALALSVTMVFQVTDTTVSARGLTRLDLENAGGDIVVSTWDRDEVRIVAEHTSRTYIEIDRRGDVLDIEAEARRGPATIVDYELTVPRTLDLDIEGMFSDVTIQDTDAEVVVETLEGAIRILGGRGTIVAENTNGSIVVEGAQGTIEATSVSQGIEIRDSSGQIVAETVGGAIVMTGIRASSVEAGTVGGRIRYEGEILDGGQYYFGSHGGTVTLEFPPGVNATVTAVSLNGSIQVAYPGAPTEFRRRERESFTLGTGSARVEAETFSGSIRIQRLGAGQVETRDPDVDDPGGDLAGSAVEPSRLPH